MADITITSGQAEEMISTLRMVSSLTLDPDHAFQLSALAVYLEVALEDGEHELGGTGERGLEE